MNENPIVLPSGPIDNYVYIIKCHSDNVIVIDPGETHTALNYAEHSDLKIKYIINTHHHWDHTDGNLEIKKQTGCEIYGHEKDAHRIPGIDIKVSSKETFYIEEYEFNVIEVDGHTIGHIALYCKKEGWLFCGDALFSCGRGRLFEGTESQTKEGLLRLMALPDKTKIYFGHEYTERMVQFARKIDPENQDLIEYEKKLYAMPKDYDGERVISSPTAIGLEKKVNPFLRMYDDENIKAKLLRGGLISE